MREKRQQSVNSITRARPKLGTEAHTYCQQHKQKHKKRAHVQRTTKRINMRAAIRTQGTQHRKKGALRSHLSAPPLPANAKGKAMQHVQLNRASLTVKKQEGQSGSETPHER
jgi:hypothetical protein